jgi:hypothetical protein
VKLNSLNGVLPGAPKDTFVLLSNNPGPPHKGGTCFGDSGGPTFDDTNSNLVVAVTSFGFSSTCSGVGGAYRLTSPTISLSWRASGSPPEQDIGESCKGIRRLRSRAGASDLQRGRALAEKS